MKSLRPCPSCRTLRTPLEPCPCCRDNEELPDEGTLIGVREDLLLREAMSATPLSGTLIGQKAAGLVGGELRDKVWGLLARKVELEQGELALRVDEELIPIVGRVIVTRVVRHRAIDSQHAAALFALDSRLSLPRYILRVETAVFVGEQIAVRGALASTTEAQTYRDVAFRRRFIGEAGRPLIVGLEKKQM